MVLCHVLYRKALVSCLKGFSDRKAQLSDCEGFGCRRRRLEPHARAAGVRQPSLHQKSVPRREDTDFTRSDPAVSWRPPAPAALCASGQRAPGGWIGYS